MSGRAKGVVAVPLAALLLSGAAWGQEEPIGGQEGPIVIGEREKLPFIRFEDLRGSLDFVYRRQDDSQNPTNGPSTHFSENRFEETLTLEAKSYIIHPNLVDMSLKGTFGLVQSNFDNNGIADTEDGVLYSWDATAVILRKENTPITLYSRRIQETISREFGPSLDTTLTTTGAVLDVRSKTVPSRFEVFHAVQEQSSLGGEDVGAFDQTQDAFLWHSEYHPSQHQAWTWDYTLNSIDETSATRSNAFIVNDANLTHSIDFGSKYQHNLFSGVRYYDQSGDFPYQNFRWDERLMLRHSNDFETRYRYSLDQQTVNGLDQTQHTGTTGFTHRLYKSLVTDGNVGVISIDRSDGSGSMEEFADLNFDYRKRVPYGDLGASLGGRLDHQENEATTAATQVINAPRVFTDPLPIVITGRNINPNTVVITDPSGLLLYQPGVDYTVTAFPDRLEISRIIGGRIGSGQTVLLDYQLSPQAANTVDTTGYHVGARYDIREGFLKGLAFYGRYAQQDQSVESDVPTSVVPNTFTDTLAGTEYRFWRNRATIGAEQQWHDSTITPFDATRFWGRLAERVNTETTLTLNSAYTILNYTAENNEVDLFTVSGTVQHQFSRELLLSATLLWRDETDRLRGDTQGLEEQIELQWKHRQTSVFILFRNANLTTPAQDSNFQFLQVGFRREF